MSVTNSPASAILRVRRLSSRRPSGRRASSSCDCCPSREPDEWTEWTTWVGQRRSAGLRSGVGRQSSKDVCVFLAPTCKLRQLGLEDASTFVLRGCAGRAGRTRARALGSSPEPIEYRASIECRYFGDVRAGSGRGKSDGVAPTPASFRRGRTKKAVWRNIRYRRGGCWGVPGCACAAGAVPHRRNRRRRLFPSIRTPSRTVQTPAMTAAGASLRAEPTEGNWNLPSKRRTQSSGRKKTSQQSPASAPCVSCGAPSCTAADAGAMHVGVWSITRASRTRRPLRRYGNEPRRRPPGVSW